MVNTRRIRANDLGALEREFSHIRKFYKESLQENECLEIWWGTDKAFKEMK